MQKFMELLEIPTRQKCELNFIHDANMRRKFTKISSRWRYFFKFSALCNGLRADGKQTHKLLATFRVHHNPQCQEPTGQTGFKVSSLKQRRVATPTLGVIAVMLDLMGGYCCPLLPATPPPPTPTHSAHPWGFWDV